MIEISLPDCRCFVYTISRVNFAILYSGLNFPLKKFKMSNLSEVILKNWKLKLKSFFEGQIFS